MKSLLRIITLSKRNLKEIYRDPLSLVFVIALPLVMEILFYALFASKTEQFQMRYLAPGIVVFSESFLTLFTGILISVDRNTSFLTRLYVSKTKPYEFILGYALSITPIVLIQSILFFLVGGIFDTSLFSINMIYAILLSFFTSILFIAFGILFGSLCNEKSIGGISSIVIMCQSLLSGMWFPVDTDGIVIKVMNVLPFKKSTEIMQNVINGINNPFNDFFLPLIIIALYSIVLFALSIIIFKEKMKSK